jgi:hypothetical protein
MNKSRKTFQGLRSGKLPEPLDKTLKYARGLCNNGASVSHEMSYFKAHKTEKRQDISPSQFKRSWTYCFMKTNALSLERRRLQSQWMPKDSDGKIMAFHRFVTELWKKNSYWLSQIGNPNQTPLYFNNMPTNTTQGKGAKEHNYLHNWMWQATLHCDAHNNCGQNKDVTVCDI